MKPTNPAKRDEERVMRLTLLAIVCIWAVTCLVDVGRICWKGYLREELRQGRAKRSYAARANRLRKAFPFTVYSDWPFDERAAREQQQQTAAALNLPVELEVPYGPGLFMEFVLIPAGLVMMGSSPAEKDYSDRESPRHACTIPMPFYMAKYEVSQKQWTTLTGSNPSHYQHADLHDELPVEMVSWHDCRNTFIPKLQALLPPGFTARLPSEAQWEHACRAGTPTAFYFGQTISSEKVQYSGIHETIDGKQHFGASCNMSTHGTVPVNALPANAWGLHHMHGNVSEWCEDFFGTGYVSRYEGWVCLPDAQLRVLRGGAWTDASWRCRSAFRRIDSPLLPFDYAGLRPILEISSDASRPPW